jgi:NTE family protein
MKFIKKGNFMPTITRDKTFFLWVITLLVFLVDPVLLKSQELEPEGKTPKVALVLSGGGAKGFAHIGVLKVLEEEGIPIDMIVGTSMGGLVGGVYSLGYNASELEAIVKSLNWETTLSDDVPRALLSRNDQQIKQRYIFSLPISGKLSLPQGVIKGQNVLNIFCGLAGNVPFNADFSKFPIPFACIATNLETGKEVVLRNGFLPSAMFSSMAIPVAFQSSDHEGLLLVDGGIVNNFPTDVAKKMGADIVIGVDIRKDYYDRKNLNSFNNVIGQLVNFLDHAKDTVNKALCDITVKPDITGFSVSSFTRQAVDSLILRGEKATRDILPQLRKLKEQCKLQPRPISRDLIMSERWHITNLTFSGNYHLEPDFLLKNFALEIPGNYSADEIKQAIDKLYGLGGFERVYYNLIDNENGKILNLNLTAKRFFSQNIGIKANTIDGAAILINTTQKNYKNIFGLLSASVELSVNPEISLVAETNKTNLPTLGLSLKGKYQNYNIFESGEKILKANIFYSAGSVYFYQPFMRRFVLGMGVQEEYFNGNIFQKINVQDAPGKVDYFLTSAYSYLSFDNMDDFYFPTRGSNTYAEFSLTTDWHHNKEISPVALLKSRNVLPLDENVSFLFDLYGRAIFKSDFPITRQTLVGGEPYSQYFNYHLPFVGLPAVSISQNYTYIGMTGLRFKLAKSQYASILFNGMWQGTDLLLTNESKVTYGIGARYSIKSFLGPLEVTLGYSSSTGKPTVSASFGFWF